MKVPQLKPNLLDIAPYVPGTDHSDVVKNVILLASNESALGPSPRVLDAYHGAVAGIARYPDGDTLKLKKAIATHHNLDPERILCGNGSDELLGLLAHGYVGEGDEVMYSQYGFLMYPIIVRSVGACPVAVPESRMKIDVDVLLQYVTPKTRMVFLANPNNPTGSYLTTHELSYLHSRLPSDVLLVIDAAYAEFVDVDDYSCGAELVRDNENVVMTRTFSKIYALAGLRLGWMYASKRIIEGLQRIRGPFNVNMVAQSVGVAALEDTVHTQASYQHNRTYKPWLQQQLTSLEITVYPSVANFLLITLPQADFVRRSLQEQGIVVRSMNAYHLPSCLRITVGKYEELRILVSAIRGIMGGL